MLQNHIDCLAPRPVLGALPLVFGLLSSVLSVAIFMCLSAFNTFLSLLCIRKLTSQYLSIVLYLRFLMFWIYLGFRY